MGDLTTEYYRYCSSLDGWSKEVPSSKGNGDTYKISFGRLHGDEEERQGCTHGWTCTCKGFKYRGTCRHVKDAQTDPDWCGWHGNGDVGRQNPDRSEDPDHDEEDTCPVCGRVTNAEAWAV